MAYSLQGRFLLPGKVFTESNCLGCDRSGAMTGQTGPWSTRDLTVSEMSSYPVVQAVIGLGARTGQRLFDPVTVSELSRNLICFFTKDSAQSIGKESIQDKNKDTTYKARWQNKRTQDIREAQPAF